MSFSLPPSPIMEKELRCPKCSLIPIIEIKLEGNRLFISTKCTNNHCYNVPFEKMEMLFKTSPISKNICASCTNENRVNLNLEKVICYCSVCYKFFCLIHGKEHNLKEDHKIIYNKKFDSICSEHDGTTTIGYCARHNKNYCVFCSDFIENDRKIKEKLNNEQIKQYEKEMDKNEEIINELDMIFNNYKKNYKELKNNFLLFKMNMNKKIEFMKEIINFYKIKNNESDLNYQMKANIKRNSFDLTEIKQNISNKLYKQIKEINDMVNFIKQKREPNQ